MAFYIDTRVRTTPQTSRRRTFPPRTLWLLGTPRVGSSMRLVSMHGESLVTSRIVRVLTQANGTAMYVQTHNSLYRLRSAPLEPAFRELMAAEGM